MTFVDRTGWRYRNRRSGKVWRVTGLTPFGWRLYPDWPGAGVPGPPGGGTRTLLRSRDELDGPLWERLVVYPDVRKVERFR